jgi:hypothetical protein
MIDWLTVVTAEERPDLWEMARTEQTFHVLWPEYNNHGVHEGKYLGALIPDYAHLQVLFVDERTRQVIARGRTIPFRWDGTLADLPASIDAMGIRAVTDSSPPTALSALAAEVDPAYQGLGLSAQFARRGSSLRSGTTRRPSATELEGPISAHAH